MPVRYFSLQTLLSRGIIPSVTYAAQNPNRAVNPQWNFNRTVVVRFTSSGEWICPAGVTEVQYLVVAGGGGGGTNRRGGGGGAGGFRTGTGFAVTPGTAYTITVGSGGGGSNQSIGSGSRGSNSIFSSITSAGGGAGGCGSGSATDGGSGGGGGGSPTTGAPGNVPSVSPSQGNSGGNASQATRVVEVVVVQEQLVLLVV